MLWGGVQLNLSSAYKKIYLAPSPLPHYPLLLFYLFICLLTLFVYLMWMGVFPACILWTTCAWCPQRPEEDIRSPVTGITGDCELPWRCWRCWELNQELWRAAGAHYPHPPLQLSFSSSYPHSSFLFMLHACVLVCVVHVKELLWPCLSESGSSWWTPVSPIYLQMM